MQLDCSAWQGQIAAALAAPADTPITPSLPLLAALLGPRSADEAEGYAQEAYALADQIPTGEACGMYLHCCTCLATAQQVPAPDLQSQRQPRLQAVDLPRLTREHQGCVERCWLGCTACVDGRAASTNAARSLHCAVRSAGSYIALSSCRK